jgi:hypothetical protein
MCSHVPLKFHPPEFFSILSDTNYLTEVSPFGKPMAQRSNIFLYLTPKFGTGLLARQMGNRTEK